MNKDRVWVKDLIPQQSEVQYALNEQLMDLAVAAIRLGLYDAHDWILHHMDISNG